MRERSRGSVPHQAGGQAGEQIAETPALRPCKAARAGQWRERADVSRLNGGESAVRDHHRPRDRRRPLPTSRELDGSDAMNPDPDYSAAYVDPAHRRPAGSRATASRSPSAAATRSWSRRSTRSRRSWSGATSTRSLADTAALLAAPDRRQPAALARPREGRHPHGDRGGGQRGVGPRAKREGKPLWQLLADMSPEQIVALRRLPLPHRRAHARRGARAAARARARPRRARARAARRDGLPGLHHLGRLARLRRRQGARAGRRGARRRASRTSR